MSTIEIPCPQCGRKLKLPDESFLGRKGRCGKCRHSFILQRPVFAPENRGTGQKSSSASPPLEFAEAPADFHDDEEPLMGVAVRVVPDATPPAEAAETAALLGETSPFMSHNVSAFSEYFADEMHQELAETSDNSADLMHARKLRDREKQKRQRRISAIVAAAIILVAAGVGVYIGSTRGKAKSGETSRKGKTTESRSRAADEETEDAEPEVVGKKSGKPNKPGEPLTLNLIPDGARIVIHLRPAELWSGDDSAEEFRACLGPLGVWLEQTIRERCLMEPASVEEATFALIPKSREAFDVAVVVRSKKELKRSDLITKFDAELVDKPKAHYIGKSLAWYIGDNRTFASAPASMAQSLVESVDNPSATSDGVQALLSMTDRRKHFTLVCDLEDVRLGVKTLAPDNAQKFLESIVDFFGDDVDAICWSLQLGDQSGGNPLQSEVLVRNRLSRTPAKLRGDLEKKLAQLP
ncbi:MAG: hypothetical protein JSS02_23960, partial [Planctomycetes bacterium]|nr:hypothetical protein [Planctomycetota bacterium]